MLGWRDLVGCSARTEAYFEADGGGKESEDIDLVGSAGFEPATSWSRTKRATCLR